MDAVALLGPLAKVRDNVIVTRETQYFALSGTFVAPADGIAIFRGLGAGGSGASSGQSTPGSGGNGGSVGVKRLRVKAGDTYAVTIPAGGAARNQNASGVAGENGGTLTIVGPGASISVPGGRGGVLGANLSPPANAAPVGLDWFVLGGRGGVSANSNSSTGQFGGAGGGGAALLNGSAAAFAGGAGAFTASGTLSGAGGAGVGGPGGPGGVYSGGGGGGSGGGGAGVGRGPNLFGSTEGDLATQDASHSRVLVNVSGPGSIGTTPSPGGGGYGAQPTSHAPTPGGFGGGGGGGASTTTGNYANGGAGGIGGGGGSSGKHYTSTWYYGDSGAGGNGWVTVEFLETVQ